jgi:hypothetical protein
MTDLTAVLTAADAVLAAAVAVPKAAAGEARQTHFHSRKLEQVLRM